MTPPTNLPTCRLVTVTTFFRVTFKNLLSIFKLKVKSRVERSFFLFIYFHCLINLNTVYKTLFPACQQPKTWTFAKISLGLLPKKKKKPFRTTAETNSSMQHSTPDHPCSSLASYNWSIALLWPSCYATAVVFELLSNFPSRCHARWRSHALPQPVNDTRRTNVLTNQLWQSMRPAIQTPPPPPQKYVNKGLCRRISEYWEAKGFRKQEPFASFIRRETWALFS